jgi:hypothetical protein
MCVKQRVDFCVGCCKAGHLIAGCNKRIFNYRGFFEVEAGDREWRQWEEKKGKKLM